VYGALDNPRSGPAGDCTDCTVAVAIKSHRALRGKTVLTVASRVEVKDRNCPPRYLIFCDVDKGKIDPFRGVEVGPAVLVYLKGILAINPANTIARLRYCFDFLDHPETEIARDAYTEFVKASDREISKLARDLPAAKLRRWLRDSKTPTWKLGLYAVLLGHCGTTHDAALLRSMTILSARTESSGMDGMLTGYILLAPKDGWRHLRGLLGSSETSFLQRYSAWRAIRYLYDTRPDVIDHQTLVEAMKLGLDQADIADLVIEDLRKWECWDLTSRILPLYGKPSHQIAIVRRAIMRYASECPRQEAVEFIWRNRKTDSEEEKFIQ
jgi:hypothetical protein